jgi:hypothetical protein
MQDGDSLQIAGKGQAAMAQGFGLIFGSPKQGSEILSQGDQCLIAEVVGLSQKNGPLLVNREKENNSYSNFCN